MIDQGDIYCDAPWAPLSVDKSALCKSKYYYYLFEEEFDVPVQFSSSHDIKWLKCVLLTDFFGRILRSNFQKSETCLGIQPPVRNMSFVNLAFGESNVLGGGEVLYNNSDYNVLSQLTLKVSLNLSPVYTSKYFCVFLNVPGSAIICQEGCIESSACSQFLTYCHW